MASPHTKLAESLEILRAPQNRGVVAVRSADLTRTHRERLVKNATDARAVLSMVRDASDVLALLLEGGRTTVAGRLAGAFRNVGRSRIADDIVNTMQTAGYDIRENDPFENTINLILPARENSPYVNRIRLMWQQMREKILVRSAMMIMATGILKCLDRV